MSLSNKDIRLWEIINEENENIKNSNSFTSKLNHINTIIELKRKLDSNSSSLFSDVRRYLIYYIEAHEEKDLNYYKIQSIKVDEKLNLLNKKEQIAILKFFIRKLKNNGFEVEVDVYSNKLKWLNIVSGFSSNKIKGIFKSLLLCTSYNLITIVSSLILILIVYVLLLLPASNEGNVLYEVQYINFSDNFYINHVLNLLEYVFSLNDDIKISPIDWRGVILGIFGRVFLITIVINYLLKEIITKIKIE
ncbi:MAG: hypothetical protein N4A35_10105 [Flavobacteriales bacterium]|jgi:hypothetical protein|nr:hypothetical protein [Flavobacteriales bacterium]